MQDVFEIEAGILIERADPYIRSYPHLVRFFQGRTTITESDVVCGAHMVYGWMPTILELHPDPEKLDLQRAAEVLTRARVEEQMDLEVLNGLGCLINNSIVGASKLLHFVAPNHFAIWDSKVYSFVHGSKSRPHNYRVNSAEEYLTYLGRLRDLSKASRFGAFHASVQKKLGYDVSPLRSLELVMFLAAGADRK